MDAAVDKLTKVFPARAGMIQKWPLPGTSRNGIPRESGDDPAEWGARVVASEYSPRERG